MDKKVRSAAEIISRLFDSLERENFEQADRFIHSWKTIVGERIAAHSKVLDVNRGSIIVEVDHPGWSQQLQMIRKKALHELAAQFPELGITAMIIRVSSVCSVPYHRQDTPVGGGVSRVADENEAAVPVDETLDDPLKDVLTRLQSSIRKGKPE